MKTKPTRGDTKGLDALLALPTVMAEEYAAWRPGAPSHGAHPNKDGPTAPPAPFSDAERRFLIAVVQNPGHPSTAYSKLARMNPSRAAAIRGLLVHKGYIREHRVATSGRGRCAIVLEPLDPGRSLIQGGVS